MTRHIFILAGDAQQAKCFAGDKQLTKNEYTYAGKAHLLDGYVRQTLLLVGTYYDNPAYPQVLQSAVHRGFLIVEPIAHEEVRANGC